MKLSQFKFNLPKEQVALYPHSSERVLTRTDGSTQTFTVTRRDEGRLMVLHRKSGKIDMFKGEINGEPKEEDYIRFKDVFNYFDEGDAFIFNDTKVFPARLYGTKEKTDAKIEVFLLRELNQEMRLWDVLVEPARKIRIGNKLFFDESGTMVLKLLTIRLLVVAHFVSFTTVLTMNLSVSCLHWVKLHYHVISLTIVQKRTEKSLHTQQLTTWNTSSQSLQRTKAQSLHQVQTSTSLNT